MFSIGNDELAKCPPIAIGDVIQCSKCGEDHTVVGSTNLKTGEVTDSLLAIRCDRAGASYLVGIGGKRISI